jgi:hypothetical protein
MLNLDDNQNDTIYWLNIFDIYSDVFYDIDEVTKSKNGVTETEEEIHSMK